MREGQAREEAILLAASLAEAINGLAARLLCRYQMIGGSWVAMHHAAFMQMPSIEWGCFCRGHTGGGWRCLVVAGARSAQGDGQQGLQGCGSQKQILRRGAITAQQAVTCAALWRAQTAAA